MTALPHCTEPVLLLRAWGSAPLQQIWTQIHLSSSKGQQSELLWRQDTAGPSRTKLLGLNAGNAFHQNFECVATELKQINR